MTFSTKYVSNKHIKKRWPTCFELAVDHDAALSVAEDPNIELIIAELVPAFCGKIVVEDPLWL